MNWIDYTILAVLLLALVRGYLLGVVRQLCVLVGMITGVLFAGKLGGRFQPFLEDQLQSSPSVATPIAYGVAFLLIYLCSVVLGRMLKQTLQGIHLGAVDRLLGSLFGGLKWMTLISLSLMAIETVDKKSLLISPADKEQSYTYYPVKKLFPQLMTILEGASAYVFCDQHDRKTASFSEPPLQNQ